MESSARTMVRVQVTQRDGQVRQIDAREGEPLMHALSGADTGIEAVCGGCLSCATCHIYVDGSSNISLKAAEDVEIELISGLLNAQPNSRLSCQIEVEPEIEGLEITVAPPEA